jgi:hypothetical protein
MIETCICNGVVVNRRQLCDFALGEAHGKRSVIKMVLNTSLQRIESNNAKRKTQYDLKNHHRSSRCIIFYGGNCGSLGRIEENGK